MNGLKRHKRGLVLTLHILLVFFFIVLQAILVNLSRFNLDVYKGVVSAFQYGICLLLLKGSRRYARRISIILMFFSLVSVFIGVLKGATNSIPGLFNDLFYLITLILISHYQLKKVRDSKTDMTTGAYNRRGLCFELEDRISINKDFSIIYLYLENFKAINDGYGHAYGDELLRTIIQKLDQQFGKECTTARLGGAEFVVIVKGNQNVNEIAAKVLEVVCEKATLTVDDNQVDCYVNCYAGVSSFPKDASDSESLIKHADIAMSTAMEEKSKEAYVFNNIMLDKMNRHNHVENLIKEGLEKEYFYLVYQPQYHVEQKKLRGFETLIRMKTDDGEVISPAEFIPIAEKNDLILKIDDYVLLNAMAEFRDVVKANPELMISVNVSAKDFASEAFVGKVQMLLNQAQFPKKNLEIEITEYCMVKSMEITVKNINALRELGIQIALDDFGTGYTSLNYVSRLPINLLKIDKSLVDDIEDNKKRRDFVHAVITMGQLMDCEVISEGVENESQVEFLKEFGCDMIQGFVWGKPMVFSDAVKLLK